MISLKGTKKGLLLSIGKGEWQTELAHLAAQLERPRARGFFRGAHVRLETGHRTLADSEIEELKGLLALHDMELDPAALEVDQQQEPPEPVEEESKSEKPIGQGFTEAALVRRTVRSGQIVRYAGPIIIFGDVNPGAEIIAGGDVFVWGRLRGVVHAGALGDDQATVGALVLSPTQLRIGGHIARAPDNRGRNNRGPEVAHIRDERIVIDSWTAARDTGGTAGGGSKSPDSGNHKE